jgi:hypothetical protein
MRTRAICIFFGLGLAAAACGGGADMAPPRGPERVGGEKEPESIEEAQEQIRIASAELAASPSPKADDGRKPEPPSEPGPTTGTTTQQRPSATPESRATPPVNACAGPCRALASMRRAVTALCRMTGDTDDRCAAAQRTLKDSEAKVASCHCG